MRNVRFLGPLLFSFGPVALLALANVPECQTLLLLIRLVMYLMSPLGLTGDIPLVLMHCFLLCRMWSVHGWRCCPIQSHSVPVLMILIKFCWVCVHGIINVYFCHLGNRWRGIGMWFNQSKTNLVTCIFSQVDRWVCVNACLSEITALGKQVIFLRIVYNCLLVCWTTFKSIVWALWCWRVCVAVLRYHYHCIW